MKSPNQYLSPKPSFARIAPTNFEIQGSKVCSTIRPLPLRHCFGWFQGNHVWKAPTSTFQQNLILPSYPPTSTFHQNLLLPGLLQPVSRSKGPKCARLSAPSLCVTVLVGFKETMYGKQQPVPFTRTFFCQDCSNQFRDPRVQSVLDYPPPPSVTDPRVQPVSNQTIRTFFCQDCSNQFRDPRVQSVLDYPPPPSVPLFLVSRKPCMESPNQYLSPEPFLPGLLQPVSRSKGPKCARLSAPSLCATVLVGFKETMYGKPQPVPFQPVPFEIQGSKVCSTIRPLPLRHCFGWFQGNHVWKAPTSTFQQNLLLPGLLQPVCHCFFRPLPLCHCFGWFQGNHVWKAPTRKLQPVVPFKETRIAPTSFEIQGSKVCSTIRPLPLCQ